MAKIRVALLGCGRIGAMHARNIESHPRMALTAVFDVNRAAAENAAAKGDARVCSSAEEVFADPGIDAVLVATVTETHADFIEMSAASGKPVLCEKPIDLSLERVNRCSDAIRGSGAKVQVGFNRRFDPGHRAVRDAMRAGDIGPLHQVIITSRDPGMPPRIYYEQAGGLLRDMTIHDFDLARFMLDDDPVEVFAVGHRLIDPELMDELDDHDTVMVVLRTRDGKQCFINNSRTAAYGYDQRVELLGSHGMLQSCNRRPHEARTFTGSSTGSAEPYLHFFIERYTESFMAELDSFANVVEGRSEPEVGFDDGRFALALAEAAYVSIAESRTVQLDEIDMGAPLA